MPMCLLAAGFAARIVLSRRPANTPRRIRTFDLRIRSPLLYPTELSGPGPSSYRADSQEVSNFGTCHRR